MKRQQIFLSRITDKIKNERSKPIIINKIWQPIPSNNLDLYLFNVYTYRYIRL